MRPYLSATLALSVLALLHSASSSTPQLRTVGLLGLSQPGEPTLADAPNALCPPRMVPDGDSCVALPSTELTEGSELDTQSNSHHDHYGRVHQYEQIPRHPERPADYRSYRYPIPTPSSMRFLVSGYDLDRPDAEQRRGPHIKAVGHGGVDLIARRGTPIRLLPLENQEGDAEVLYVGPLFGMTVVTRHTLRESGRLRDYIVLYGHLDAPALGLQKGASIRKQDLIGYVGDSGSVGLVHLHLEMRRLRDGVNATTLPPGRLMANDQTIVVDPRNLLPLRNAENEPQ